MSKKNDYFRSLVSKIGDENTSLAEDGLSAAEYSGYIDTGSYALNALISGSIHNGIPNNKSVVFAGPTSTGKTFFVLGICKHFLNADPNAGVIYYDTESAVTRDMLVTRGLDPARVLIVNVATVEDFRFHALKFLEHYTKDKKRPPMLMVLDSLGMLVSNKAMVDSLDEKKQNTKDMTITQVIKGTFRILRLKMTRAVVPMLITNHTYAGIGQGNANYTPQVMAGGNGPQYAADDIIHLSKKQAKNGKEIVGNIVHAKAWKSRTGRENRRVDVMISYDYGLDPTYGLLEIAEDTGILVQPRGKDFYMFGEQKISAQDLASGVAYTDELLMAINEAAEKQFSYGHGEAKPVLLQEVEEELDSIESDTGA